MFVDAIDKTGFQHELSTAGSQKSEPTVGARGSRAPKGLVRGGPPGIPGKPRPALRKPFAFSGRSGLGARRLVVAGVMILAEIPLEAGAPTGGIGEITTGGCWAGSVPGAFWADPVDHPPKRLKQIEANSVPNNWGIGGRVGGSVAAAADPVPVTAGKDWDQEEWGLDQDPGAGSVGSWPSY